MRKHRLFTSFATSAVVAGAAIGTAVTASQPATAAPAQRPQPLSDGLVVHDFMVANNLLKFEHAAYWHVVDGKMVFAKDPVATAVPVQHTFSAPPVHQTVTFAAPVTGPTQHAVASSSGSSGGGGSLAALRQCESGGNYSTNTGNGYYGAYQFTQQTWASVGMSGSPASASPAQQDAAARRLQAQQGWSPWPACSAKLALH